MKKLKNSTERMDFLIKNWEKHTNIDLAKLMGTTPGVVATMAKKARQQGFKLLRKTTRAWASTHPSDGRDNIDWKKVKGGGK